MSDIEPITVYHFDPDKFEVRTELVYPDSVLNEMAWRVGDKLDEEILARLGYVKPVRCRDCCCYHRLHEDGTDLCARHGHGTAPDAYCAWGVRRGGRMSCTYEPPKQEAVEIGEHIDGIGTVLDPDDEEMIGFLELASKRKEATKMTAKVKVETDLEHERADREPEVSE